MPNLDENGYVRADPRAKALAIVHCELCDDDGYRNTTVCDHIDHTEAAKRGMALVRATMGWKS